VLRTVPPLGMPPAFGLRCNPSDNAPDTSAQTAGVPSPPSAPNVNEYGCPTVLLGNALTEVIRIGRTLTGKLWFAITPAAYFALPAWLASITHVPAPVKATVASRSVQPDEVWSTL
jgi:hypothetical protein